MHVIFYIKATAEVVGYREDMSSPALSEAQIVSTYLSDNNITDGSIGHAVITGIKLAQFERSKYLYNESTNSVIENPDYVAPVHVPEPTPAEPTV